jgi:hypothetical protein
MSIHDDELSDKRPQFLQIFESEYKHFGTIPKAGRAYAIAVYVCLASHASNKNNVVFPSYATICAQTGLARNTAIKAIDALTTSGHISVKARFRKGERTSNLYTLLPVGAQNEVVHHANNLDHDATKVGDDVTHVVHHANSTHTNEPETLNQSNESEGEAPCRFATSPKGGTPPPSIKMTMDYDEWRKTMGRA